MNLKVTDEMLAGKEINFDADEVKSEPSPQSRRSKKSLRKNKSVLLVTTDHPVNKEEDTDSYEELWSKIP